MGSIKDKEFLDLLPSSGPYSKFQLKWVPSGQATLIHLLYSNVTKCYTVTCYRNSPISFPSPLGLTRVHVFPKLHFRKCQNDSDCWTSDCDLISLYREMQSISLCEFICQVWQPTSWHLTSYPYSQPEMRDFEEDVQNATDCRSDIGRPTYMFINHKLFRKWKSFVSKFIFNYVSWLFPWCKAAGAWSWPLTSV